MKKFIIVILAMTSSLIQAQVTTPFNTSANNNHYVGWDSNTLFDLNIRHEGNFPIVFSTNNQERMRLNADGQLLINLLVPTSNAAIEVIGKPVGVRARAVSTAAAQNYGGWFTSANSSNSYGVRGDAINNTTGINYGVAGNACNAQVVNYAVYGTTCNATNFAGYFDGPTFSPGAAWTSSDENLKTNIQDLTNATDALMSMEPKTYFFDQNIEYVNLPEGLQYGLLAQNLETIVPHAVRDIKTPTQYDDEGNVTVESATMKAVNYNQLIPLLIAGFKEQSQTESAGLTKIEELTTRLSTLEKSLTEVAVNRYDHSDESLEKVKLEQNFPNPFYENTTIAMEILEPGNVRVDIVNDKGEVIETLRNQQEVAGIIELIWNSKDFESGIYFYVVRHNGNIAVNKMMKL